MVFFLSPRRFLLDVGHSQDLLALQVALAPCTLGYGAVAQMLYHHPNTKKDAKDNIYWNWIENYVAEDYREAVQLASGRPPALPKPFLEAPGIFVTD